MKLENYEVHLPSYSIGNTIYDKIGPVCESYGRKSAGHRRAQSPGRCLRQDRFLREADQLGDHWQGDLRRKLHLCYRGTPAAMPLYQEADMVFGVGGGKAWTR